jgi:hypothetical protein
MSKVNETLGTMLQELEYIGYSKRSAIKLIKEDIEKANMEIALCYAQIDAEIDRYIDSIIDKRKGG